MRVAGVDIAREGVDKSVLYGREDMKFLVMDKWSKADSLESAGRVIQHHNRYRFDAIIIDCDGGYGAGVLDILRDKGLPVIPFHGNARCERKDSTGLLGFRNMRSYAYWNLRDCLDPRNETEITLPRDDELIGQLCTPRWFNRVGLIQLEAKDEIKKRTGKSPDCADAMAYCYCDLEASVYEDSYVPWSRKEIERDINPKPKVTTEQEWIDKQLWGQAHRNHDIMSW
jgi:hypothetical protein